MEGVGVDLGGGGLSPEDSWQLILKREVNEAGYDGRGGEPAAEDLWLAAVDEAQGVVCRVGAEVPEAREGDILSDGGRQTFLRRVCREVSDNALIGLCSKGKFEENPHGQRSAAFCVGQREGCGHSY